MKKIHRVLATMLLGLMNCDDSTVNELQKYVTSFKNNLKIQNDVWLKEADGENPKRMLDVWHVSGYMDDRTYEFFKHLNHQLSSDYESEELKVTALATTIEAYMSR